MEKSKIFYKKAVEAVLSGGGGGVMMSLPVMASTPPPQSGQIDGFAAVKMFVKLFKYSITAQGSS